MLKLKSQLKVTAKRDPRGNPRNRYRWYSIQTRADLEQIVENTGGFCVP